MSTPTPPQRILVTGGAGYIGSHACLRLVETGHSVVGLDDFSRGHPGAFRAIAAAAEDLPGSFTSVEASIGDRRTCAAVLREHQIDLVMHFAALTYVGESVEQPLRYYENNTGGAISLLEAMMDASPSLNLELDLGWVQRAGHDPVEWINKYAGRISAAHIKDIAPTGECADEDGWADVGHGTMDWPAITAALAAAGVSHFVIEHDNPSDHERFARRSLATASTF